MDSRPAGWLAGWVGRQAGRQAGLDTTPGWFGNLIVNHYSSTQILNQTELKNSAQLCTKKLLCATCTTGHANRVNFWLAKLARLALFACFNKIELEFVRLQYHASSQVPIRDAKSIEEL